MRISYLTIARSKGEQWRWASIAALTSRSSIPTRRKLNEDET